MSLSKVRRPVWTRWFQSAWCWPLLLTVLYLVVNCAVLHRTVNDPELARKMQDKDSAQYVDIARDFAAGDLSMSYVETRPHRQPLYPLLLAPALKLGGGSLAAMGCVNIITGLAMLLALYFGLLRLLASRVISVLISLAFITNVFMVDKIAARLMSEPLHAASLTIIILHFLGYVRTRRRKHLLWGAAFAGLDYLARTNGLFVMLAMCGILLSFDLWLLVKSGVHDHERNPARWRSVALGYIGAVAVFALVTTPSWLPRYHYFKSPFSHGYLSNFLWVDNYDEAHTGLPVSSYTWKDYAASHTMGEFLKRWAGGMYRVYYDVPKHVEPGRVLYLMAIFGMGIAVWKRRWEFFLLILFMFVQLLPVVWTSLANPGPRIPYGSLLPFELFFAALGLEWIGGRFRQRFARSSLPPVPAPSPSKA